ncbi:hypothetical protein PFICI_01835 [Pestalotiopsis fici W106-1]|uniref:Mid2 domain-containing protein n=1 Tax=Pestalotiopsis fici (strain W106-1 / CGMCC3.15140) TaxID=1229662 RepID=W3XR65_PESFW|nr:uncharacterized protein PFICI_01835 [Pestalotiopsis fici W106-1]ETS88007.1 hypothetical protein PFICI_01835 [Pestalotiopsis fici W106-1]
MTRWRGVLRAWMLAAALSSTISTTLAMSVPPSQIFARDSTCGDTSYSQCPQAGLPDNFCCKPGTSCIALAGNTTIVCCPDGDDCSVIASIVCDVQLQNATSAPDAVVKTTALTSKLPTCGSMCCPFGYTCDADNNCAKDEDQSQMPEGAGDASSTASATGTTAASTGHASTAAPTATATDSAAAGAHTTGAASQGSSSDASDTAAKEHAEGANVSAIVGGVVGGVVFLVAAIIGAVYLVYRRRKQQESKRASDQSFISRNARGMISNPIPQDGFTYGRSDFISRSNPSTRTAPSQQTPDVYNGAKSFQSRDSISSYSSSPGHHDGSQFDGRSYHPSAIIDSLKVESEADKARAQPSHLERVSEDQGNFETIDISFNDTLAVPDFDVGRRSRDTTLTQWPGARPGTSDRR